MSFNRAGHLSDSKLSDSKYDVRYVRPEDQSTWFNDLGSALLIITMALGLFLFCPESHSHVLDYRECNLAAQSGVNFAVNRLNGRPKWIALQELREEMDDPSNSLIQDSQDENRILDILDVVYSHIEGEPDNSPGQIFDAVYNRCIRDLSAPPMRQEVPDVLTPIMPPAKDQKAI